MSSLLLSHSIWVLFSLLSVSLSLCSVCLIPALSVFLILMSLDHVSSDLTMPCPLGLGARVLSTHFFLIGQIVPKAPSPPLRELFGPQYFPSPLLRKGGGSRALGTQSPLPFLEPLDLDEEQASK